MTLALKMADIEYDAYENGFDEGFAEGREAGLQVGLQQGLEQGLEQGISQGAYETKLETAKSMLNIGIPLEQVQICTKLPLDVVQGLL